MKIEVDYYDRIDIYSPYSEVKRSEIIEAETEDAIFEELYKRNNRLRYCNGCYYKCKSNVDDEKFRQWNMSLSHNRSFNLYYGNGVVD